MRSGLFLTGWARMRFIAPDPAKLMSLLAERGILFREAAPPEDCCFTAAIPLRQAKDAARTALEAGGEAKTLEKGGLPAAGRRLRRRIWPTVLLTGVLLALLWSQTRIWDIEISGNAKVPDGAIRQALAECGVDIGAPWLDMSQDAVRNGVILRLPDIRWMTVSMRGSRACVIVRERREAVEPVPEKEYASIAAEKAGLVTAVYALRGTAVAEENHVVLPGETIIGGYATGRFGVLGPVRAMGWAEVRSWYDITAAAPADLAQKTGGGKKTVRYSLIFAGRRINFYKGSSICPVGCDKIIEKYALAVPGVFTLPLAVERTTITSFETQPEPAQELPEELEQLLYGELKERIGPEGEILSASSRVWEENGLLCVTLSAECRERIGEAVPLTEEEIGAVYAKIPKTEE